MQFFGHREEAAGDQDVMPCADGADLKAAYDRGRSEERARHHRHPVLAVVVGAIALAGASVIGLAAAQGSFAGGGQVIDQHLAVAASQAEVSGRDAVAATGEVVRDAGDNLRHRTLNRAG